MIYLGDSDDLEARSLKIEGAVGCPILGANAETGEFSADAPMLHVCAITPHWRDPKRSSLIVDRRFQAIADPFLEGLESVDELPADWRPGPDDEPPKPDA